MGDNQAEEAGVDQDYDLHQAVFSNDLPGLSSLLRLSSVEVGGGTGTVTLRSTWR